MPMGAQQVRSRKRLSDERVAELLDIATEVFLEKGYAATGTGAIAERANASKSTFYKRFPSKEDLFRAVIERRTQRLFDEIRPLPQGKAVEPTLRAFGRDLLHVLLRPEQIRLIRLIGAEADRHPTLAHFYFQCGPARAEATLERYLTGQITNGALGKVEPGTMARAFVSLVTGSPVRWYVLGFDPTPITPATAEKHVENCVHIFLQGTRQSEGKPV